MATRREIPEMEGGDDDQRPLRDRAPWQAAAYAGAVFTILTAIPLYFADWDNAMLLGIAAGAVVFVLGGLYLSFMRSKG